MTNEDALILEGVSKHYGDFVAVGDLSLRVPRGAIYGLLGPNGAGKSTSLRMVNDISVPDRGAITLFGTQKPGRAASERIGYLPEERGLYPKMKVCDLLQFFAELRGISRAESKKKAIFWLERLDISDWADNILQSLSKGMQQKVQFIATVIHQPRLLILDEPFSGLDPINTNLIKDEIRRLNSEGVSIIFSTHRMEQVEEICEDIVLINQGKNILQGKVSELKHQFKENLFKIEYEGTLPSDLKAMDDADDDFEILSNENNVLTIKVENEVVSNRVLNHLIQNGVFIHNFNEILPSLNEIFIKRVNAAA